LNRPQGRFADDPPADPGGLLHPIADHGGFTYTGGMAKLSVLLAAVALCACGRSPDVGYSQLSERDTGAVHLPFDYSVTVLNAYSLGVTRAGELQKYLHLEKVALARDGARF
jgi:hypothetical protein